jgi:sialate O-acetylesterase
MRTPRLTLLVRTLTVIGLLSSPISAAEKLSLSSLFADHAVLQCDVALPVWGETEPGSEVTVEFAGQMKSATAAADGK